MDYQQVYLPPRHCNQTNSVRKHRKKHFQETFKINNWIFLEIYFHLWLKNIQNKIKTNAGNKFEFPQKVLVCPVCSLKFSLSVLFQKNFVRFVNCNWPTSLRLDFTKRVYPNYPLIKSSRQNKSTKRFHAFINKKTSFFFNKNFIFYIFCGVFHFI